MEHSRAGSLNASAAWAFMLAAPLASAVISHFAPGTVGGLFTCVALFGGGLGAVHLTRISARRAVLVLLVASTLVGVAEFHNYRAATASATSGALFDQRMREAQREAHNEGGELSGAEIAAIKTMAIGMNRAQSLIRLAEAWLRAFCFGLIGCLIGDWSRKRARVADEPSPIA